MLTLKNLYWSNAFSYGSDNELPLNSAKVTQLVGLNGHGKSSIPLILQEVLYNKNSKGVKKVDIPNRLLDSNGYSAAIEFDLDGSEYFFSIERKGASTKTELLKDGEEIGHHTATATYNQVKELIGMDFTTFSQLVYQSAASSLEFLTATDTQRKKFLISLLNLEKYTNHEKSLTIALRNVSSKITAVESSLATTKEWLRKNKSISTKPTKILELPEEPSSLRDSLTKAVVNLSNLKNTNKSITANNKVKEKLKKLQEIADGEYPALTCTLQDIFEAKGEIASTKSTSLALKNKLLRLGNECPTCESKVDKARVASIIKEQDAIIEECTIKETELLVRQNETEAIVASRKRVDKAREDMKFLAVQNLPNELLCAESLQRRVDDLNKELKEVEDRIKEIRRKNEAARVHNTKVNLVLDQIQQYETDLIPKQEELDSLQQRSMRLSILKRAFGTKGLVAYKIEVMVKDLENLINEYLIDMSDGKFSLAFVVSGDKLNVELTDEGNTISIAALSSGELARVNISTLLAIRKLMNTLSKTKLNLLFLDEVTSVLDDEGRERLVEVLNKEEDINSFIVSHGWQHPLVDKIGVLKENNISRVEF